MMVIWIPSYTTLHLTEIKGLISGLETHSKVCVNNLPEASTSGLDFHDYQMMVTYKEVAFSNALTVSQQD